MAIVRKGVKVGFDFDVEQFVQAFMESASNREVAERLNIAQRTVCTRSDYLRLIGIALPFRQSRKNHSIKDEFREIDKAIKELHGSFS